MIEMTPVLLKYKNLLHQKYLDITRTLSLY